MADSKRKKVLDAALKALLASADSAWWLKGPATFIAELSVRSGNLPENQRAALAEITPEVIREALLQLELATKHAANASAGVDRIEDHIEELRNELREMILTVIERKESTGAARRPPDPSKYLRRLHVQTESIDIRGLEVGSGKATRLPIDKLYIHLATSGMAGQRHEQPPHKGIIEDAEGLRAASLDLREALQHRCLAIVGDPGSGKSTFLRRVAFELCRRSGPGAKATGPPTPRASTHPDDPDSGTTARAEARGSLNDDFLPSSHPIHDGFPILIRLADLVRHMETCRDRKFGHLGDEAPRWLAHYGATDCLERV